MLGSVLIKSQVPHVCSSRHAAACSSEHGQCCCSTFWLNNILTCTVLDIAVLYILCGSTCLLL
jgi:hypothetical protein